MAPVLASLTDLLSQHRDQILLRVVSGSQAYGLAMATSDTDERGIFVLPAAAYASLREPVEHLQDERGDVVYLALRKFLSLANAANPSALEVLFAPPDCVLLCAPAADALLAARSMFVTQRCVDSHVGYARAQIQRARGQNKWINNPQPVEPPSRATFCHVILGPWPGRGDDAVMPLRPRPLASAGIDLREYHCAALEHVPRTFRLYHYGAAAKGVFRGGHLVCESIPAEHEWSHFAGLLVYDQDAWEHARKDHANYWQWRGHRNEARWRTQEAGEIDYDAKNLMHTFRLLASAEAILREGQPRVRFAGDERAFLLRVRAGAFAYDELVERAEAKVAELLALARNSALPAEPDAVAVDELLHAVTAAWANDCASMRRRDCGGGAHASEVHDLEVSSRAGIGSAKREAISTALTDLAAERHICILHACESGSRAWGFASPDSDYDIRFLFVHARDWYLRVRSGRDTITRMLPGDLDLAGWDLRKALGLCASSNAALFEHLGSDIVYRDDGGLLRRLRSLVSEFFNPIAVGNHYFGLVRKMRGSHLGADRVNIKKLFYVLRPIAALQWIEQRSTMPPTRFDDVLAGVEWAQPERGWIADLQAQKAALREADSVVLDPRLRAWIDERIAYFGDRVSLLPHRVGRGEVLDRLLVDMLRA